MKAAVAPMHNGRVQTDYQSKIEWVPLRFMIVRRSAQRKYRPAWAKEIAANFDPDALGYPVLVGLPHRSNEDEHFHVLDGQHRVDGVRIALGEDQSIQCEVIRGIDLKRAAAIYRMRNNRRQPRAIDDYLIGVTAHDPECLAIQSILRALNLKLADAPMDTNTMNAASSVRRVYRLEADPAARGTILRRVLTLATEAWTRAPEGYNGDVLVGLGLFLARHGKDADAEVLERKLRGHRGGPLGLLGNARQLRIAVGGNVAQCVARAVVLAYNVGLRKGRLPEWGEK